MMKPEQGDVWVYEYLWHREHEAGAELGRKARPTAMIATVVGKDGRTNLFILAITTKEPGDDRLAVEIPQFERHRAGLSRDRRLWVILDEYNHEILETSFHLAPNGKRGTLSPAFVQKTLGAFIEAGRKGRVRKVPRSD